MNLYQYRQSHGQPAVAQEVYLCTHSGWGLPTYALAIISKITPSGQIVIKMSNGADVRFSKDGREIGSSFRMARHLDFDIAGIREHVRIRGIVRAIILPLEQIAELERISRDWELPRALDRLAKVAELLAQAQLAATDAPQTDGTAK